MDEWYSYGQIIFNRSQIEWVLRNYELFSEGRWPPEHRETGYTSAPHSGSSIPTEAYFVKPSIILAEVESRIQVCGLDGFLVEEKYLGDKDESQIAVERHLELREVFSRINKVLAYAGSGPKRRRESYAEWKRQRGYKRVVHNIQLEVVQATP